MPTPTYTLIREAIAKKQQVIATYDGYHREMCPHVIGYKDGGEHALFYQFAGDSSKGKITKDSEKTWRCMVISKLKNVSVRDGEWHTSQDHSKRQTCVDRIDLEVAL